MKTPAPVSVLIYTLNEEVNLPGCLESLSWCEDIIVIDSFSTDATERIAREAGSRFYQHEFSGFGSQRNWSLDTLSLHHDWVLILDADERVPPELASELATIASADTNGHGAYRLRRRLYMWGRWLKHSSLYPTWVVRFIHKDRVRYVNRGHAETQNVDGRIGSLEHDLIDENLKDMQAWLERQCRYALKDAEYELQLGNSSLQYKKMLSTNPLERRALLKQLACRVPFRPFLFFFYSYCLRMGFLDGRAGLRFCLMKALYQRMIMLHKHELLHLAKD